MRLLAPKHHTGVSSRRSTRGKKRREKRYGDEQYRRPAVRRDTRRVDLVEKRTKKARSADSRDKPSVTRRFVELGGADTAGWSITVPALQ